jgi:hypothetical protein
MAKTPGYLIVGKGRWGARMHQMLAGDGRCAGLASRSRRMEGESDGDFEARMAAAFRDSGAQIAWLCVTPGAHVPPLIRAALAARMHVMVEKPWVYSRGETAGLQEIARRAGLQTAVHFEFCMLAELQKWRKEFGDREGLTFGGIFDVSAGDHSKIPVMQNLGSHLVAVQEYAVPRSAISRIACHYEAVDQRRVFLDGSDGRVGEIDFLGSREKIIQRFLGLFEESLGGGIFPFDFDFGRRVEERLEQLS